MSVFVYVGNLGQSIDEAMVREAFEASGTAVQNVVVLTSSRGGQSRGFGFVEVATEEEALAARTAMDGREIGGRTIRVGESRERRSTSISSRGSLQGFGSEENRRRGRRPGSGRPR
jgi:cold-inducible RNA-binding protein